MSLLEWCVRKPFLEVYRRVECVLFDVPKGNRTALVGSISFGDRLLLPEEEDLFRPEEKDRLLLFLLLLLLLLLEGEHFMILGEKDFLLPNGEDLFLLEEDLLLLEKESDPLLQKITTTSLY